MLSVETEFEELINDIVSTTKDYKNGKVMNAKHVTKWIEQFHPDIRLTILQEMSHILKKHYVSKKATADFMEKLLNKHEIVGDFITNHSTVHFLDIQRNGQSQKDLLELLAEVMEDKFDIKLSVCGLQPKTYVYFDDCIFSGNTLLRDMEIWVNQNQIKNVTVHFVSLAMYNGSRKYLDDKLKELFKDKNVKFEIWRIHEFGNKAWEKVNYQCLWPTEPTVKDEHVQNFQTYIEELRKENGRQNKFPLFRPADQFTAEALFTTKEAREVVEQAFLKHGSHIFSFRNNDSFKPMGYSYFLSTGFGSLFVTYRNVANNSPLVLWWGDPTQGYPLNQWYPLFPRSVNQ
ncbi:hypothetical protein [Paenibacillus sp. FSL H8-0079]|uniref:phosphoribosyltransferase-like protein n=1 Tax=Paenibacillus sp. FSL H8-0079 TaxID=2921375 RepID=UPI0030ED3270